MKKKIIFIIVAILGLFNLYNNIRNGDNFEDDLIDRVIADNQVGKKYQLKDFLSSLSKIDYVDFSDGSSYVNDLERIGLIRNSEKIKVFRYSFSGIDEKDRQIFPIVPLNVTFRCSIEKFNKSK
ncbi:hypothetical protein [Phocoenobacter skyensis]|uniref:Uncharacterized protein n=1 Tax=Phocoenobacter skyensis TaxID=97481 RepID=A0AAJ6NDK1_9PAST|nr:hypothetical protein [Pasteurella skyensis]MDP8174862.1 hypothetical protein [Pasteurella skyensis]